ncbi:unnamed protein product [Leuciscus chuanchicus]
MKSSKFKYQRVSGTTAKHCCVPQCQASGKDKFTVTPHTRVCSRHFRTEDIREPTSEKGRRLLKKGVAVLFEWNNFSLPPTRPGVWERRERPPPPEDDREDTPDNVTFGVLMQHDYASKPEAAVLDLVLEENTSLREENRLLSQKIEGLTLRQRFGIHRFAASDKDIRFFTTFASYDLLMRFWGLIANSLPSMVTVRQAQRGALTESNATNHSLQPIDKFFLFLNYLALGSKQRDLADRYGIHQFTVSRIITTWSNFLFTVLGSVRIWKPEEEIQRKLPADFKDYPDTTVIR